MVRKYEGVGTESEVSKLRRLEDIRPWSVRLRDWWLTPDGQTNTLLGIFSVAILLLWAPMAAEFVLLALLLFSHLQLRYKKMKWDFPLRIPIVAGLMDGSTNKTGAGLMLVGNEVGTNLPATISDNDARTHALIFGTTGSGKTELLLAFIICSLVFGGGGSYTDGKGDVKLWLKFLNACRMFGREDDLLLISFITSGHEFYDRQETKISNTINPYATGSSGMCTEASIALMDSSKGGDDMWKGRAIAFLGGLIKPLVFLRDRGEILLDAELIREYFDLPKLERLVWDESDTWKGGLKREAGYFLKTYGRVWKAVIRPLEAFMVTIPGYDKGKIGKQDQKTLEQHGYIVMQLARLFGDLADNYGHIMRTPLGEVEMYDVVINDRILVTLLPALERSPESLGMLGKIIVGGIKQMAAGCLGNRVEGLRREIVDARPTNSPVPFPTIFDEYGYYAVLGFSSMPAQARSLGFMVIFAAQDFASLKKSSPEEADQTWENTNLRGIGRITSGSAAETYKRMEELGGNVDVPMIDGFEIEQKLFGRKLRASQNVRFESRPRVSHDDLHSQADGEFHLFLGKKERGAERGRMRVVRVNAFYTETSVKDKRAQPSVELLRINHFARVAPPPEIISPMSHPMVKGENGIRKAIAENILLATIRANESHSPIPVNASKLYYLNAELDGGGFGLMDLAFATIPFITDAEEERKRTLKDAMSLANVPSEITKVVSKSLGLPPARSGSDGQAGAGGNSGGGPQLAMKPPTVAPRIEPPKVLGVPPVPKVLGLPPTLSPKSQPSPPIAERPEADVPVAVREATAAADAPLQLSDEDKEALAKISLFTAGEVSIPVNTATEKDLVELAQVLLEAGHEVFGGMADAISPQDAAIVAQVEGELRGKVKGLDKEEIIDTILSAEPAALGPADAATARENGRAFVEKMALGSCYLETPVPSNQTSVASFQDAVDALAEAVMKRKDE